MGHVSAEALRDYLDKHPEAATRLGPAAVEGVAKRAAARAAANGAEAQPADQAQQTK